jgi:hypothetical protein
MIENKGRKLKLKTRIYLKIFDFFWQTAERKKLTLNNAMLQNKTKFIKRSNIIPNCSK